ncbi:MAG: hypothetical protein NZ853_03745 [Leptospiraceae bacterium]|nr:hypothetical protein [Leptospiraceae bacterium]MDW7975288.1 hypothetical protein [Leptospiraceae bacterium]
MKYRKYLFVIICFFVIPQVVMAKEEPKWDSSFLWEVVIPGYNFFREEEYFWGGVFLALRLASIYSAITYHERFLKYQSLEKAAKTADIFYGQGIAYKDPIGGGYQTTKGFSILAGRSLAYRDFSISVQLLLLGIGIYKGYMDTKEKFIDDTPPELQWQFSFVIPFLDD